jgi:hypothetical protein
METPDETIARLMRERDEARSFLVRTAQGGTVVSSAAMTPMQIAIARAAERMLVMPDGLRFVYVPGPLAGPDPATRLAGITDTLHALTEACETGGVSASRLAEMLECRIVDLHGHGLQGVANMTYEAGTELPEAIAERDSARAEVERLTNDILRAKAGRVIDDAAMASARRSGAESMREAAAKEAERRVANVPGWIRSLPLPEAGQVGPVATVAGDLLPSSLKNFERSCLVLIDAEQEKAAPDQAIVAVLCDAVRLAREHAPRFVAEPDPSTVTLPALPTDADDEAIVDALVKDRYTKPPRRLPSVRRIDALEAVAVAAEDAARAFGDEYPGRLETLNAALEALFASATPPDPSKVTVTVDRALVEVFERADVTAIAAIGTDGQRLAFQQARSTALILSRAVVEAAKR